MKKFFRMGKWQPLSVEELHTFFGLQIIMGIKRLPEISDHWGKNWIFNEPVPVIDDKSALYGDVHDAESCWQHRTEGTWGSRIRSMFQDQAHNWHVEKFVPGDILSETGSYVAESICPYKGRLSFRQYMPKKLHRFAIKNWVLCESSTGYTYDLYPYVPSETHQDEPLGSAVVKKLMQGMEQKGPHVYMDRYFSSPALFTKLKEMGIAACGTVNPNFKGLPLQYKNKQLKNHQKIIHAYISQIRWVSCCGLAWQKTNNSYNVPSMHHQPPPRWFAPRNQQLVTGWHTSRDVSVLTMPTWEELTQVTRDVCTTPINIAPKSGTKYILAIYVRKRS